MSGIIGQARERKMGYNPASSRLFENNDASKRTEAPKILDLQLLKDYIPKVLDFMKPEHNPSHERYRKHSHVWEVPIHHLLGKVNEPTWVYMIETQAKWFCDNWQAIQPNGRWHIYDYEIRTETRDHTTNRTVGRNKDGSVETMRIIEPFEFLIIGIQIVDITNGEELIYDMGRPSKRREPVNTSSDRKIEEQAKQLDQQREQITKLQADLSKQNELMTALLTELQSKKTPPRKRVPKK